MIGKTLADKLSLLFGIHEHFIDYEGLPVTFHKNNSATQQDINSTFSEERLQIPNDYKIFLRAFNGCTLFKYEDLGGFVFLGTKDIAKETEIQKQTYKQEWNKNLIVFCRPICDGDFISFKVYDNGSYDILDCYHDDNPRNWKVISNSFEDFLERLIDEKGKKFWL